MDPKTPDNAETTSQNTVDASNAATSSHVHASENDTQNPTNASKESKGTSRAAKLARSREKDKRERAALKKFFLCFQILEMDTYRYHGHSMSDPGSTYRTRDEMSGVRQERDPIERIRKLIFAHDIATDKDLKDIEKEVRKEVDEAIAKAKESPMPEPFELFKNIYVKDCGLESHGADRKEVKVVLP